MKLRMLKVHVKIYLYHETRLVGFVQLTGVSAVKVGTACTAIAATASSKVRALCIMDVRVAR
jgi:hypothetical protein